MPIYDFSCLDCRRTFDELMRSDTQVQCPGCGGARVERMLSLPARPASGRPADFSSLGPPPGGGCCGGGCQGHSH